MKPYTPYWETEDPAQATGPRVVALLRLYGFPTVDSEERNAFAEWWSDLPNNTLIEVATEDATLAFEAMAYAKNPLCALELYQRTAERKALLKAQQAVAQAENEAASWKKELEAAQKTLEAAQLEILRLKAEIYDLHYEARAGA